MMMELLLSDYTQLQLHSITKDMRFWQLRHQGERSGWGAGVGTLDDGSEFSTEQFEIPGYEEISAWSVDGPPAFCVLLTAMLETFGKRPELVISGSNDGANCGRGILHSGTVGSAMIAQNFGLSGIALGQKRTPSEMIWETSGEVAVAAVNWIVEARRKTVLNINIPNTTIDKIKGVRVAQITQHLEPQTSLTGTVLAIYVSKLVLEKLNSLQTRTQLYLMKGSLRSPD